MITRSTIDGWLNSKEAHWFAAAGIISVFVMLPISITVDAFNATSAQADKAVELAKFWQAETMKWREIAGRETLRAAMSSPQASKCDAEKCVNVCTGEPAMKVRP